MTPRYPKEFVKWQKRIERMLLQDDVDIKRLWRRMPQGWRGTDGFILPSPFPLVEVLPPDLSGSAVTAGSGFPGTANTAGSPPSIGCPCGESGWRWDGIGSPNKWQLWANYCGAGCMPVEPKVPGAFHGQTVWTCCQESLSGTASVSSSVCSGVAYTDTIFQDGFFDVSTTNLEDHTPNLSHGDDTWDSLGAATEWQTGATGVVQGTTPAGLETQSVIGIGESDYQITNSTIGTSPTGTIRAGNIFRWSDSNNYWLAVIKVVSGSATDVELYKVQGGSRTLVDSLGSADTLETIECCGNSIQVKNASGVVICEATNSFNATATQIGLHVESDSSGKVASFTLLTVKGLSDNSGSGA